ncbi:MAG: DUF6602 domain-containing protein [Victivallales bacterium]
MERNFEEYHKSIAAEITSIKNRIRNLIGNSHWLTDGEHKEAIIRRILRDHIPEIHMVGTGFVCFPDGNSSQIDILITRRDKPKLFTDGELTIITADAVDAIIEVKTNQSISAIKDTLKKLSIDISRIRKNGSPSCKAGLFIYETMDCTDKHMRVLAIIKEITNANLDNVINWVAVGNDDFYRFWKKGEDVNSEIPGPVWHAYELKNLSHAYFISNVVWELSKDNKLVNQFAWFPVSGGKEIHRKEAIGL